MYETREAQICYVKIQGETLLAAHETGENNVGHKSTLATGVEFMDYGVALP